MKLKNLEFFKILAKEIFPKETYVVGGFVRDLLLHLKPFDIDVVIIAEKIDFSIIEKIQRTFKINIAKFEKNNVVVFRTKLYNQWQLDISFTPNLIEDLSRRDFTINAMALPFLVLLEENRTQLKNYLIDPFGGWRDLEKGLIIPVKIENIISDPLRILRAYRFKQQLSFYTKKNFKIPPSFRKSFRQLAPLLKNIPKERITYEILKAMKFPRSWQFYYFLCKDNIFPLLFKNCENFLEILKDLKIFEEIISTPEYRALKESFSENKTYLGDFQKEEIFKIWLLKLHCKENPQLLDLGKELEKEFQIAKESFQALFNIEVGLNRETFQFLQKYEKVLFDLMILLHLNYKKLVRKGASSQALKIKTLINEIMKIYKENYIPSKKIPINGKDLIKNLNLPPSPQIGRLLNLVRYLKFIGKISNNKEEVLKTLTEVLKKE
jgi:tRNA nucleotidyltransferase/poly(A) polymerase